MATMEKPKQKKKKKTKAIKELDSSDTLEDLKILTTSSTQEIFSVESVILSEIPTTDENETTKIKTIKELDCSDTLEEIEVLTTSSSNEIISVECSISSEIQIKNENEKTQNDLSLIKKPVTKEISADLKEESTFVEIPSAPILEKVDTPTSYKHQYEIVKYPSLNHMINTLEQTTHSIQNPKETEIILIPFNETQIKDFYYNPQLKTAEQFENEFILTELDANYIKLNHTLYEYLNQYSKTRSTLKLIMLDIDNLRSVSKKSQNELWRLEKNSLQIFGNCVDGIKVQATETYEIMTFDENKMNFLQSIIKELTVKAGFQYTENIFVSEVLKIKIEQKIREVVKKCCDFFNIGPVTFEEKLDSKSQSPIDELRTSISILFAFMRRPMPDKEFFINLKTWIIKLVAVQLRIATWQDHLFIMYHILRCPKGTMTWAAQLVQVPNLSVDCTSPFDSPRINHCISLLSALLLPIKKRNEFLEKVLQYDLAKDLLHDDIWTMIDSDGEEGHTSTGECSGLKESDLVLLINQIPLENLFSCVTFSINKKGKYECEETMITGNHLLKLIALSTTLIDILGDGMINFEKERYRQFAKRLARLVRHIILYVTDIFDIFRKNQTTTDLTLITRVQVEYSSFVLRTCRCIYMSRLLGTWQYLVDLPFSNLDIKRLWNLYYLLNIGFADDIRENFHNDLKQNVYLPEFRSKFNDIIIDLASDDLYYLLQTFCNMILSREKYDWEFITLVTQHLVEIGFLNSSTKEICYKTIKDILVNITAKYPEIISYILKVLHNKLSEIESSGIYIFKSLNLENWHPNIEDFNILSNLIINFRIESIENSIARLILSNINWGFNENNRLFLSYEIHLRMAFLLVEVSSKHVPELVGSSGLSEGVRQVSYLYKNQSAKTVFTTWCWNMASKLRLHLFDLGKESVERTLRSPADIIVLVPELEKLTIIYQGVMEMRPLALYLAVLTSLCGHSIPEISYKGFEYMQLLLNDYRHSYVIRCLELIAPLFLDCPEILSTCEKFNNIITQLLNSDRTYLKIAKDLLSTDSPGLVLELFGNMIQAQIINYLRFGFQSPTVLINFWLQCLINNTTNWYKDWNRTYTIDLILKIAYQFPESWHSSKHYFREILKKSYDGKSIKPGNFVNLFSSSGQPPVIPGAHAVWLSLLILELEHEIYEINIGIWPEMLKIIEKETNGKNSIENSLKKTINQVGCSSFFSSSLVVYKLANLILISPIEHPLLPIVCQQFFYLYLYRIPKSEDETKYSEIYGVADKFFDGNITLMKKLKKRLSEIENFYKEESLKQTDIVITDIMNGCSRLFRSYLLWLEETRLNTMNAQQIDLPPQYDSKRLAILFCGNSSHWTEFIHLQSIRNIQQKDALKWLKESFRYINQERPSLLNSRQDTIEDPKERIFKRLKSYDLPVPPPVVINNTLILDTFLNVEKNLVTILKYDFLLIEKYSKDFEIIINELKSLDCQFKEFVIDLYNVSRRTLIKRVPCSSIFSKQVCKGAAKLEFKIPMAKINENIQQKIIINRDRHCVLIDNQLSSSPENLVLSLAKTSHIIKLLVENFNKTNLEFDKCENIRMTGINFFYLIINDIKPFVLRFPPAKDLYIDLIKQLGIFIKRSLDTEGINLLDLIIKRSDFLEELMSIFLPLETTSQSFLTLYGYVIENYIRKHDPNILYPIILKFELKVWIEKTKPRLADFEILVKQILVGLENWNLENSDEIQKLLRQHLVIIFEHNFPDHYGEVLHLILKSSSEQKLLPIVIMDIIESLYKRADCLISEQIDRETYIDFANKQNFFSFKEVSDTISMLAKHYQNERLQHGIYGLYPKQKIYCDELSILFGSLSYASIVSAIHLYQGALAEQLVNCLWPNLCDLFSPWLVPYHPQHLNKTPSNWIQQMTSNNPILLPWSDSYLVFAQKILNVFINSIQFLMEMLPAGTDILNHIFHWYEIHFANTTIPKQILNTIHTGLMTLHWHKLNPNLEAIDSFNRIFQQFLPDCHIFGGYIFLNVPWTQWIQNNINKWNYDLKMKILSSLLMNFIKLSCEPHIREGPKILELLKEAYNYPWYLLECKHIEFVLDWFVMSIEPSVILKLPSEHLAVDNAVISLLQNSCGMFLKSEENSTTTQFISKRIIYVRSITRLLRICGSKYQQLLGTAEGLKAYRSSVINFINMIDNILFELYRGPNQEATNLMIEIVGSLQTQDENTSKLFIDAMVIWQNYSVSGSIFLCSTFDAIGNCKKMSLNLATLLEATINNYFRSSDNHFPSWKLIFDKVGPIFSFTTTQMDGKKLVDNQFLLCLHLYCLKKLKILNTDDKIILLQNLHNWLQNLKSNETIEPHVALLWGLIIVVGSQLMLISQNSRNHLLTLARYLQVLSNQSEGWGEGLLGAIGLKKDNISNKRRILTRCLSCFVFSLFPQDLNETNTDKKIPCKEYEVAMLELNSTINNRKYNDIRSIAVLAINIIEQPTNTLKNSKENVCSLIRLFYKNNFLNTLEDIWNL